MKKNTLTVGLLAFLATSALGQAKLTGIETNKVGDGLQIVIKGEGLSNPRTIRVNHNTSYIVEFDAHLAGKAGSQRIGHADVKSVQYVWYKSKPPIVRVHFRVSPTAEPVLTQTNGVWTVSFGAAAALAVPNLAGTDQTVPVKDLHQADRDLMAEAEKLLTGNVTATPSQPSEPTTVPVQGPIVPVKAAIETKEPATMVLPDPFVGAKGAVTSQDTTAQAAVKAPKPAPAAGPGNEDKGAPQRFNQNVSLDFVGTDIVQILKALSIQAGVNIITSPDVSPTDKPVKLTISLSNIDLESALSYVTAMGGLRYARIGNTFVVTPSASFSSAMRQIMERSSENYRTKVVNLVSGEAEKIKEATVKAIPQDGRNGYYEIIVPGQNDVTQPSGAGQAQPQNGKTGEGQVDPQANGQEPPQGGESIPSVAPKMNGRAFYLMIVGDPNRLSAVEDYVRKLDIEIAASFSLSRSNSTGTVAIPIQSGQTQKIKSMIEKLLMGNPRASDYSITETSVKELAVGEESTKFLLMIGPDQELSTLKSFAVALDRELCKPLGIKYIDDVADMVKDYEVVELKYLEPIIAAQDLKGRFKDLWVTVVPDNVTPGLLGEGESKKEEAPTDAGNGQNGAPQKAGDESKLKKIIGREPMRLILRGTRNSIEEAKLYLAKVDIAPRQIALEMRVMELSKEDALKLGIDWSLSLGKSGVITGSNGLGGGALSGHVKVGSANFTAQLDSIANNRNLIARPNALVSDGRQTKLFVGDTVRYVKSIQSSQNGVTVVTDEIQVGSQFDIKARVGDQGAIALDLTQNFTLLTGFLDVPNGGKLPQTSDRMSSMFVNMKSGETIAIGGLILDQDIKNYSGIPWLKDLPIIGRLFGKTSNSRVRTEIVFFLTAVEVTDQNRPTAASPRTASERSPDPLGDYKKSMGNGNGKG
ncbi:MAG: hypothetical protein JST30_05540 [Armatimonadetes bacterium]|nr:hypothetical protein [Armatimonadota bacterium]